MKLIPITGYIDDRLSKGNRRRVSGFAFQVAGFEWFHTWATRGMGPHEGKWLVSHWESGMSIGSEQGVVGESPMHVAELVIPFLQSRGVHFVRQRVAKLGYPAPTDIKRSEQT